MGVDKTWTPQMDHQMDPLMDHQMDPQEKMKTSEITCAWCILDKNNDLEIKRNSKKALKHIHERPVHYFGCECLKL